MTEPAVGISRHQAHLKVLHLNITFLGTGTSQGVPVLTCQCDVCNSPDWKDKRLRTSAFIEAEGRRILIDAGPDFRLQAMREQIQGIDALLFTHEHRDHVAGLDDVRPFNFIQRQVIQVYANKQVQESLLKAFYYIFGEKNYPGIPRLDLHTIDLEPFWVGTVRVIPILVYHYKLPVLGFRIGDITYITDANYIAPEEMDKIRGSRLLVLNALQKKPHISHFTLDQAVDLSTELGSPETYLTHLSHDMGRHEEVSASLPQHVNLAYDGLKIHLQG